MPNSGEVVYPSIDTELHLWQQMSIGGHFSMVYIFVGHHKGERSGDSGDIRTTTRRRVE